jgi:hypothetical protein
MKKLCIDIMNHIYIYVYNKVKLSAKVIKK